MNTSIDKSLSLAVVYKPEIHKKTCSAFSKCTSGSKRPLIKHSKQIKLIYIAVCQFSIRRCANFRLAQHAQHCAKIRRRSSKKHTAHSKLVCFQQTTTITVRAPSITSLFLNPQSGSYRGRMLYQGMRYQGMLYSQLPLQHLCLSTPNLNLIEGGCYTRGCSRGS